MPVATCLTKCYVFWRSAARSRRWGRKLVLDIVKRSRDEYDCNSGEILDEIGERLGICSCCAKASTELVNGFCRSCRYIRVR